MHVDLHVLAGGANKIRAVCRPVRSAHEQRRAVPQAQQGFLRTGGCGFTRLFFTEPLDWGKRNWMVSPHSKSVLL
jgi:hypothetical protein